MSDLRLIDAVKGGDLAEATKLIKAGLDVNQPGEQDWTPLNFAAGNGDLPMVKLLVESGADIFRVGRDRRTPSLIALAAGHQAVVNYLREAEDGCPDKKIARPEKKYCKAYRLGLLRRYSGWSESRINWTTKKKSENGDRAGDDGQFTDNTIVFIHQDFTVTEFIWHNENVIFDRLDPWWHEFCVKELTFSVPEDLDLIVRDNTDVEQSAAV